MESSEAALLATSTGYKRLLVESHFTVMQLSLILSQGGKKNIALYMKGLTAGYLKRPFDFQVDLSLRQLIIEDKLQHWGTEFRYLATSETDVSNSETDLMFIRFNAVQKNSPAHLGVDFSIDYRFNSLDFVCK